MTRTLLVSAAFAATALGLAGGCGTDDRPATWSYIHEAIIAPNCTTAACHNTSTATAGVKLHTSEAAYAILVGHACDGNDADGQAPRNFVDPGSPESSRLMYLLRGDDVRRRMPPDRALPAADIDLVERWILDGAPCD
jgi:hypothetical protein